MPHEPFKRLRPFFDTSKPVDNHWSLFLVKFSRRHVSANPFRATSAATIALFLFTTVGHTGWTAYWEDSKHIGQMYQTSMLYLFFEWAGILCIMTLGLLPAPLCGVQLARTTYCLSDPHPPSITLPTVNLFHCVKSKSNRSQIEVKSKSFRDTQNDLERNRTESTNALLCLFARNESRSLDRTIMSFLHAKLELHGSECRERAG